jgi:hypothetical protein
MAQVALAGRLELARLDKLLVLVLPDGLQQPYLVRPLGPSTTETNDLSTRRASIATDSPGATALAAAASNPPTNTARLRSASCSALSRRLWLHSTAARTVR